MNEGYLHLWGKNYPNPTLIKNKVTLVAAGENHILFVAGKQTFGMGSNKFGQLGLKEPQFYQQPIPVFQGHVPISLHCGAEHTFFINEKYEVYSMGLNIKGQLGHSLFDNVSTPKLVAALLPFGLKNKESANPQMSKPTKSPIIEILEKFDLQVKIEERSQKMFLMQNDEYVISIACGALFTIALTNKGKVLGCGLIGGASAGSLDEQVQKTKFKVIQFDSRVDRIRAGLSGAVALSKEGRAFIWGKFGKTTINIPKKAQRMKKSLNQIQDQYVAGQVGDEFVVLLTSKGEILVFGQNIDNQLGCESYVLPYQQGFNSLEGMPLASRVFVGRNNVFAVEADSDLLYGWGSNKYGQIFPVQSLKGLLKITNSKFKIDESDLLVASSYFSLLLTRRQVLNLTKQFQVPPSPQQKVQTIALSEYRKILNDYQLLKALNMTLLQKYQPSHKQSKQIQTTSKFEISGVTQYRKFNSNVEIAWKEIQLQSQINEGGYGLIYKAKWREIQVVVKKFKIENGDVSLRDFLSECHAMQAVRHPNIVMFLGAVTVNPHYSIILQYCSKGSLWSYLQNKDNAINWEDRRRFAIEIAQGVLYLHLCSPPILHRDLKSLNIFLDASLRIKIGDFGWTKTLEEYMTNKIGTYQWMAPQVIGSKPYTEKADVFSYSIIMWEIASRQPPYRNINGAKVSEEVLNRELRPTIPSKCPESFSKLMRRCWESDPSKRPNFREIIRELQVMKLPI